MRWPGRLVLGLVWAAALWPFAMWWLQRSDPELAVRCVQIAARVSRDLAIGTGGLGVLLLLAFPPARAAVRLLGERARLQFASDRGPLLKALGELQHFESAARHHEVGRLALSAGELRLALPHLLRAVELDPQIASAQFQLGRCLLRIGDLPRALAAFAAAEVLDPGHAFGDALLHQGRVHFLLGDARGARQVLEAHAQRHGGGSRSHVWLAEARDATGDREGGTAALRAAAAPPSQRTSAEEQWFRAVARVRLWRRGGAR